MAGRTQRIAFVVFCKEVHLPLLHLRFVKDNGPILRSYDASNLTHELYTSQQNAGRDSLPAYNTFSVPTITNGAVFVGSGTNLVIFGLLD